MASVTRIKNRAVAARRQLGNVSLMARYLGKGEGREAELRRFRAMDAAAHEAIDEAQEVRYDLRRLAEARGLLADLGWLSPDHD